jgi:signal transduction histidine kinase
MDIRLISRDPDLDAYCRETLAGIPGFVWTLSAATGQNTDTEGDLYIWDFQPNISLPEHLQGGPAKHLFLVDRKDLARFQKRIEAGEVSILLKPVTRATLTAFLGLAASSRAATSLRAERDQILQCLIQTNLKLQEYDQERTNFLARAVHDFRAPLTAISGYCGLLLDEPLGPLNQDQKEVLQRMQHSAKRLSRMASAMFQLSIGRHVKRRPDLQKGDIRECLDQALHEIAPFAEEKRITITPDLDPSDEGLLFEYGQIEQVLINILDNACKFTPKAGIVEIRGYEFFWERRIGRSMIQPPLERRQGARQDPNGYRIDIADSGARIPQEHLDGIFEEYTSYSGGRDRSGGGLGLAICRMIIAQHGGRVWAENTDSGPVFSIVLPIHRSELHTGAAHEHETQFENAEVW